MSQRFIDVHSHVAFPVYDQDREGVLKRMREVEVSTISVGVDLASSKSAVALAEKETDVFATIGLHPNNAPDEGFDEKAFRSLLRSKKVVGIGECGLDYFRRDGGDEVERARQKNQFEIQVYFAIAHNKPLMIHCRPSKGTMDAYRDLLVILKGYKKESGSTLRGNVHFFVGNREVAHEFLELGFTFSFTGVITFARDYDEVIRYLPKESILTETDCPYVAPHPHRGERNEPSLVTYVVDELTRIRGANRNEDPNIFAENAKRVFEVI